MTCTERFFKEHPNKSYDFYVAVFNNRCPSEYGYLKDPDACYADCSDCWNREIPELDETTKAVALKEAHETIKAKCAELMKTNEELMKTNEELSEEHKKLNEHCDYLVKQHNERLKRKDDDIKILEGKLIERDRQLEAIKQILYMR